MVGSIPPSTSNRFGSRVPSPTPAPNPEPAPTPAAAPVPAPTPAPADNSSNTGRFGSFAGKTPTPAPAPAPAPSQTPAPTPTGNSGTEQSGPTPAPTPAPVPVPAPSPTASRFGSAKFSNADEPDRFNNFGGEVDGTKVLIQQKNASDVQLENLDALMGRRAGASQALDEAYYSYKEFQDARDHQGAIGRFVEGAANTFGVKGSANNVEKKILSVQDDAYELVDQVGDINGPGKEFNENYKNMYGFEYDPENPYVTEDDPRKKDGKWGGRLGEAEQAVKDYNESQKKGMMAFNITLGILAGGAAAPIGGVAGIVTGAAVGTAATVGSMAIEDNTRGDETHDYSVGDYFKEGAMGFGLGIVGGAAFSGIAKAGGKAWQSFKNGRGGAPTPTPVRPTNPEAEGYIRLPDEAVDDVVPTPTPTPTPVRPTNPEGEGYLRLPDETVDDVVPTPTPKPIELGSNNPFRPGAFDDITPTPKPIELGSNNPFRPGAFDDITPTPKPIELGSNNPFRPGALNETTPTPLPGRTPFERGEDLIDLSSPTPTPKPSKSVHFNDTPEIRTFNSNDIIAPPTRPPAPNRGGIGDGDEFFEPSIFDTPTPTTRLSPQDLPRIQTEFRPGSTVDDVSPLNSPLGDLGEVSPVSPLDTLTPIPRSGTPTPAPVRNPLPTQAGDETLPEIPPTNIPPRQAPPVTQGNVPPVSGGQGGMRGFFQNARNFFTGGGSRTTRPSAPVNRTIQPSSTNPRITPAVVQREQGIVDSKYLNLLKNDPITAMGYRRSYSEIFTTKNAKGQPVFNDNFEDAFTQWKNTYKPLEDGEVSIYNNVVEDLNRIRGISGSTKGPEAPFEYLPSYRPEADLTFGNMPPEQFMSTIKTLTPRELAQSEQFFTLKIQSLQKSMNGTSMMENPDFMTNLQSIAKLQADRDLIRFELMGQGIRPARGPGNWYEEAVADHFTF